MIFDCLMMGKKGGHYDSKKKYQSVLDGYLIWLRDYHNNAPGTVELRSQYLLPFLRFLGNDGTKKRLSKISPQKIETFFLKHAADCGQAFRRSLQATLRTFFRYCFNQGYIHHDLSVAVPTLRTYKLDKLPRDIADEEANKLLSHINRKTNTGRRDYAIIQLLYTYGIRGGQVRALRLSDINWAGNQIRFAALKHGKEILQPLTDQVGESLLDYLRNTRPQTSYPEVFLTMRSPYIPLKRSTTLSEIIARNMRAANIKSPSFGAHVFRHGFASRMVNQGYSLKSIADMIGHSCIQTTFIYTKVDFQTLKQVALDWPEEV